MVGSSSLRKVIDCIYQVQREEAKKQTTLSIVIASCISPLAKGNDAFFVCFLSSVAFQQSSCLYTFGCSFVTIMDTVSRLPETELPAEDNQQRQLYNSTTNFAEQLNNQQTSQGKILIDQKIDQLKDQLSRATDPPRQISMQRLTHLQDIFKHYCTHIFRVGKHMTFDRLQYEKVHMAMDRFFKFLSDFGLTTAIIDGRQREIISKSKIITVFKKVSINCKDLGFEQFIECLERIAIVYYDEKESYRDKLKKQEQRRRKMKENLGKKKVTQKTTNENNMNKTREHPRQNPNEQPNDDQEQKQADQHQLLDSKQSPLKKYQPESDEVEKEMENGNVIDNLIDQIDRTIKEKQQESEQNMVSQNHNEVEVDEKNVTQLNRNESDRAVLKPIQGGVSHFQLDKIPNEQKVELFYKMIGVDNIKDYRNKLSQLNLPVFKSNNEKKTSEVQHIQQQGEPKSDAEDGESVRLQKIKQKISEKKAMVRNQTQTPKKIISNQQNDFQKKLEQRRLKKQKQRQRLEKAKRVKDEQSNKKVEQQLQGEKKKVENSSSKDKVGMQFKENSVTWGGIEKLNFEQLNIKQFHPHNLYNIDQDDEDYMGDLKFDLKNMEKYKAMNRIRERKQNDKSIRSSINKQKGELNKIAQQKQKKVEAVVFNAKKRVSEIEKSEKTKEKNIDQMTRKLSESRTPRKVKV